MEKGCGAAFAGLLLMGCSNAPPNIYQTSWSPDRAGMAWSLSQRLILPMEGRTYRQFRSEERWVRGDGKETSPYYVNMIDLFTLSMQKKAGPGHFGLYSSNFYPGVLAGFDTENLSVSAFSSATLSNWTAYPGIQVSTQYKPVYLGYSLYRQRLGSYVLNPAAMEPGPHRKVIAERYNLGFRPFLKKRTFGFGVFADRVYWKGIYTSGIEMILNL